MSQHSLIHGVISEIFNQLSCPSGSVTLSRLQAGITLLIDVSSSSRWLACREERRLYRSGWPSRAPSLSCTESLCRMVTDRGLSDEQVNSGWVVFFFFSSPLGQMRSIGFYATIQESIVCEFDVMIDPRGMRWYLYAIVVSNFSRQDASNNILIRILVFLLLTWLLCDITLIMTCSQPKIYLIVSNFLTWRNRNNASIETRNPMTTNVMCYKWSIQLIYNKELLWMWCWSVWSKSTTMPDNKFQVKLMVDSRLTNDMKSVWSGQRQRWSLFSFVQPDCYGVGSCT